MALNSLGIGILLSATDNASHVLDKVRSKFVHLSGASDDFIKSTKKNAAMAAAGFVGMKVGMMGLRGALNMADDGAKYQTAMSHLAFAAKAGPEQMKIFRDKTITATTKSMYGPVETVQTLKNLAAQGYNAADSMKMLEPALNLATASMGELGLEDAAAITGQTLRGWSISADEAGATVDKLTNAARRFSSSPKDIRGAVSGMAAGALLLKQDLTTSLVAFGLVKNVLAGTELSANAVKVSMMRMASGAGAKTIKGLGINTWDEKQNKFKDYFEILFELQGKLDKMHGTKAADITEKIFGTRASGAAQVAMKQLEAGVMDATGKWYYGVDAVNQLKKEVNELGTTASQAEAELATYNGQVKLMNSNVERLKTLLGEPFMNAFQPVLKLLNDVIISVANTLKEMPESTKNAIAKVIVIGAAVLTAVSGFVLFVGAIKLAGLAFTFLGMTAGTILIPLAAAAAAIAVLVLMYKAFKANADQVTGSGSTLGYLAEMAGKAKLAFQGLMQLFSSSAFSGEVMKDINKAENAGVKQFAIKVFVWIERIRNFFRGLSDGFSAGMKRVQPQFDLFVGVLKQIAAMFGISVGAAKDNISAWEAAGDAGAQLGDVLAVVAEIIVAAMTIALRVTLLAIIIIKSLWLEYGDTLVSVGQLTFAVVQLIAGLLSGDWDLMWNGALGTVENFGNLAIDAIMAVVKACGWLIDAFGWAFGGDAIGLSTKVGPRINAWADEVAGRAKANNRKDMAGARAWGKDSNVGLAAGTDGTYSTGPAPGSGADWNNRAFPAYLPANQSVMPAQSSMPQANAGMSARAMDLMSVVNQWGAVLARDKKTPFNLNSLAIFQMGPDELARVQTKKNNDDFMSHM
jgi:TP901 family phage tail tape measure protein